MYITELEKRRDELEARLDRGYDLIKGWIASGKDKKFIEEKENKWIEILHEYEAICDKITIKNSKLAS